MVDDIIKYENGDIGDTTLPLEEQLDLLDFFQDLVNSGLAWQLQGHYGRVAARLIRLGLIHPPQPPRR